MTRATRARGEWRPAATLPVARVAVDVALAHLDRPFDYRVPAHLDEVAAPGVRVRVRFAGRLVDGFLLERVADTDHAGRLAWVDKVVSPEPVLTAEVAALCRAVADRYAGVLADVLRLAVPPRHARVEAEVPVGPGDARTADDGAPGQDGAPGWARYPRGPALLDALAGGRAAHAVWQALPGESWADRLAEAAAATVRAGRGALLVVPDQRDVAALHAACTARLGERDVVALTAELGPAERYRRWLTVRRGAARVVVGTRSAVFAPLGRPGLLAVWDDGDDLHAEPRAPYPHVRDVLLLRAHAAGAALLVGGFARTAEAQVLVDSGWAREVVADRATVRAAAPRVTALNETGDQVARDPDQGAARLPAVAFEAARAALTAGRPVLVQVPRAGYLPWLSCAQCRETARCRHCAGPLSLNSGGRGTGRARAAGRRLRGQVGDHRVDGAPNPAGAGLPHCRWCGRAERRSAARCARRAAAGGGRRGRAHRGGAGPRVPGRDGPHLGWQRPGAGSGARPTRPGGRHARRGAARGGRVRRGVAARRVGDAVPPGPAGGRGDAAALDGRGGAGGPGRRRGRLGRVVVVADAGLPPVQALVRWDPAWHAAAELAARTEVGFPPAVRMASVEGAASAVAEVVDALLGSDDPGRPGPPDVEVLGPVELDPEPGADPADATPRTSPGARAARAGPRAGGSARRGGGPALGAQGARPGPGAHGPPEVG